MKKFLTLIALISVCMFSCKEDVREELQILIKNEANDAVFRVSLFPKDDLTGVYAASDIGGVRLENEFDLPYNTERRLFYSGDIQIEPYALFSKIFDSVHISAVNSDVVIIKFTHDTVIGYSENLFTKNTAWNYEIREYNQQTATKKGPVKAHCYRFSILKDKITVD
jgi:hypothetical protein